MPAEKESYARRFRMRRQRVLMSKSFVRVTELDFQFPLQVLQAKKKAGAWHLPLLMDCCPVRLTFRELCTATSTVQTALLSLFHTGVTG